MIVIKNLKDSLKTLEKCYDDYLKNPESEFIEYITDSCIKRFEYTLESAWKLMKKIFIKRYGKSEQELTMNNIFRYMQGYGYTENWENWRNYYDSRNTTAHEYSLCKSRELIKIIPDFLEDVEYLIHKLDKEQDID